MAKLSPISQSAANFAPPLDPNLYFVPGEGKRYYTYNPADRNKNAVYLPSTIDYNKFMEDMNLYNKYIKSAKNAPKYGYRQGQRIPIGGGLFAIRAANIAERIQKKYKGIGSPSEGEIARYSPNQVGYVESQTTPLVRRGAGSSSTLSTISARRSAPSRLSTIQGQVTGLNPLY